MCLKALPEVFGMVCFHRDTSSSLPHATQNLFEEPSSQIATNPRLSPYPCGIIFLTYPIVLFVPSPFLIAPPLLFPPHQVELTPYVTSICLEPFEAFVVLVPSQVITVSSSFKQAQLLPLLNKATGLFLLISFPDKSPP